MAISTGNHLMLPYEGDAICMIGRYDYKMIDRLSGHSVQKGFVDPMLLCRESLPTRGISLKKYMSVIECKGDNNV